MPAPGLHEDARALDNLAQAFQAALDRRDRDGALAVLNELRERARHAFALVKHWEPQRVALGQEWVTKVTNEPEP